MNPALALVAIAVFALAAASGTGRRRPRRRAPAGPVFPVPGTSFPTRPALGYLYKRTPTHWHRGIDVFASEGSPVVAPFAGIVEHANSTYASGFSGYGQVVVLRSELAGRPLYVLFAHLASVNVQPGQHVAAGQQVGTVGRTAYRRNMRNAIFSRSNAHLHFETSLNPYPMAAEADRIDPVGVLRA